MRYLKLTAIAKRLKAVASQSRLVASAQSNRLRLKDVFIGIFIFIKYLFDSVFIAETVAKSVGKNESDNFVASDLLALNPVKGAVDNTALADDKQLDVEKVIFDNVYHTDDVGGEASVDDDQTIQFIKVRSELAFVTDSLARTAAYQRQFTESLAASDLTLINVSVGTLDLVQVVETTAKLLAKGTSDTLAGIDSGTLLNQDYVDNPFYFADDYVGVKRVF
tara:strand:- start:1316 stop:1978 length:663 start_codon:yes stop_codon:yes gene_type:complete